MSNLFSRPGRHGRHVSAILLATLLLTAGCDFGSKSTRSDDSSGRASATNDANPHSNGDNNPADALLNRDNEAAAPPAPLLDGWDKPAVAIVLSGEQRGYFEPCGCTELQLGGMSRRADLFKKMRSRGWDVTAVDVGGDTLRQRRQSQLKFETILNSMRDMQYRAVAIGPEELRLGLDFLLSMHVADTENPENSLSLLAANVVFYDSPELGTPLAYRTITVGEVTIGVTAILGTDFNGSTLLDKNNADLAISDPNEVLPGVIDALKQKKPDLMILLSHTTTEESRKLAARFPDFDLVLTAGGPEDADGIPEKIGKSLLLSVGRKGKTVGVIGYYPESSERFRFELVELDQIRFRESANVVEHMRSYQLRIEQEQLAGHHQDNTAINHPSGSTFVGSKACGNCHQDAYEIWLDTEHARGFERLKHARDGAVDYGITRIYDAECLTCHVTGWDPQQVFRYNTGFINEAFAENDAERKMNRLLKGVGCESCHGPGSKHIELINNDEIEQANKLMRVTLETAKKNLCFTCHDADNSPDFEFDIYWPDIEHYGLD